MARRNSGGVVVFTPLTSPLVRHFGEQNYRPLARSQRTQKNDTTQEARMSTKAVRINDPSSSAGVARVDMKFEVVVIPVSDLDRAKEFYGKLGWRLDAGFD